MLPFGFSADRPSPLKNLCLGAHSDDIEIGCGGTILRLTREIPELEVRWIVLGAAGPRRTEAIKSAQHFLRHAAKSRILVRSFRDGFLPYLGYKVKDYFERLKCSFAPDLIFTHYRRDLHQDHRIVSELTWNTFRDHLILEYEVMKYDGDLGSPNFFVHLHKDICTEKVRVLQTVFRTQNHRAWFTEDTFLSLMRLRGVESNAPTRYAEAFYCSKIVF